MMILIRMLMVLLALWGTLGPMPVRAEDAASSVMSQPQPESVAALPSAPPVLKGRVQTIDGHYVLAPGDTVAMKVYGAPEFDQTELSIRPDGYMTIPPIGPVHAAGMDLDTLSATVRDQMKRYLKNPDVTFSISKYHPAIVYVLGAVQRPGAYEVRDIERPDSQNAVLARGRLTVSNLIANAGGIMNNANIRQVEVKNAQDQTTRTVDLARLLKEGDSSQDLLVQSGDTVYIPELAAGQTLDEPTFRMMAQSSMSTGTLTVRVLGKVAQPGVYKIDAQTPGVNSAIASAKGYMIEASKHDVKILRDGPNGQLVAMEVDPNKADFALRNNDIIVVDERPAPVIGRGFDYATRVVLPFLSAGNLVNSVLDIVNPGRRFPFRNAP